MAQDHDLRQDPSLLPERLKRDAGLRPQIERIWRENFEVYGARKVWRQLEREEVEVARCTIERQMRQMGLQGVVRGRKTVKTVPDRSSARPPDLVDRRFRASRPNELWGVAVPVDSLHRADGRGRPRTVRRQPW